MNKGFWAKLDTPFFALAPMYDVTDAAFRQIIAKYGKPDVFYTEFVSTDGLQSEGQKKLLHHLQFSKTEHPIVAQIFGTKPEKFAATTQLCEKLGFDGVDINMGCPDKTIIKRGSCAALIRTPELAQDIVTACKEAADIPVSVKIRIGDSNITEWQDWILALLKAEPAAIAIHLRSRSEMSKVPAHWELMPEIVQFIHDNTTKETRPLIIGNGDIATLTEAQEKVDASHCDGVMIGRGIFGNPWLFNKERPTPPSPKERLEVLMEHINLYEQIFTDVKSYDIMKRHFKAYVSSYENAAEIRGELYPTKSVEEAKKIIQSHLDKMS